jgi:hypothetical protein
MEMIARLILVLLVFSGLLFLSSCMRVSSNIELQDNEINVFLAGVDSMEYSPSFGCYNKLIYRFVDSNTALVLSGHFLYGGVKTTECFSSTDSVAVGVAYFLDFPEKILAEKDSVAFVNYCTDLRIMNVATPKKYLVNSYDLILLHHTPCIVSVRIKNMNYSDSISFLDKDVVFWKVDICNVPG